MDIENFYCDKCNNIMSISKTPYGDYADDVKDQTTPQVLSTDTSNTNNINIDYMTLLKKVEDGKKLSTDELKSIDIKEMVKDPYYKKLTKKGDIKKSIVDMIDDMDNSDENINAYHVCNICMYSKRIIPGCLILSKNREDDVSYNMTHSAKYRNRVHSRTMPITRNFNCMNKTCPVHTDGLVPEAIFFRKNANDFTTYFICKRCLTVSTN